jgi:hypothetical protein
MKTLFLAWQDPQSRAWFPVGRLTHDGSKYQFVYTKAAQKAQADCGFQPLRTFPELEATYESDTLFPLFSNRLLSRSRPDYQDFVSWLNVPGHEDDPVVLLARSGGRRATDELEVFPSPEPDSEGQYRIHFFVHGLRHLPPASIEQINRLKPCDPLLLLHDFQNPRDRLALALRTDDPQPILVGYCPRYLVDDAFEILRNDPDSVRVAVERINPPPAPLRLRLLCHMTARWPDGFVPYSSEKYRPIVAGVEATVTA